MKEKEKLTKDLFELLRQGAISANINTLERLENSDDSVWNENYGCLKEAVSMLDEYRTITLVLQEDDTLSAYGSSGSGNFDCKQLIDRWKSIPNSDAFSKRIAIRFYYEDNAKVKHEVKIIGEIGYNRTFANFDEDYEDDDDTMTTIVYIDGKPQTSRGTNAVSILSYTREVGMSNIEYDYAECNSDFVKMLEYIVNDSSVKYHLLENDIILHYHRRSTYNFDIDNIVIEYSYQKMRNYNYTDAVTKTTAYAIERLIKSGYIAGALDTSYSCMCSDEEDETEDNASEIPGIGSRSRLMRLFCIPDIYSDAYNEALKRVIDRRSTIIADVVEEVKDTSSINVAKFFNDNVTWFRYSSMLQNTHERWEKTKLAKCAIFYSQLYSSDSEDHKDFCVVAAYIGRFMDETGIRKDKILVDIDSGLLGCRSYIFEDLDHCSDQLFSISHCYKDIDTLLARVIYDTDVNGNCIWKDINSVGCNEIDICNPENAGLNANDIAQHRYIIAGTGGKADIAQRIMFKDGELISEEKKGVMYNESKRID